MVAAPLSLVPRSPPLLGPRQEELFELAGWPMVENCVVGYNSTLFTYGQTGSGKTYTMFGADVDSKADVEVSTKWGVIPCVFQLLFSPIGQKGGTSLEFSCTCSFLEIYKSVCPSPPPPTQIRGPQQGPTLEPQPTSGPLLCSSHGAHNAAELLALVYLGAFKSIQTDQAAGQGLCSSHGAFPAGEWADLLFCTDGLACGGS
ncbi:unnamed protein product [Closterium sp. NIES-53]